MRSLLLLAGLAAFVVAAPPSRFNKPLDENKLDKDWQDPESDDWHEDTYEWKRKEAAKRKPQIDLTKLMAGGGLSGGAKDMMLQQEANSGNMQMAFATLKKGVAKNEKEIEELAGKWQGLLMTNGVKISSHAIGGDDILITEDNGRIMEVRDFMLNQPEIEKFRWKDTDFTPTPAPAPKKEDDDPKKGSSAKQKKNRSARKTKAEKAKEKKEKAKKQKELEKEAKKAAKRLERQARRAAAKEGKAADAAAAPSASPSAEPLALPIPAEIPSAPAPAPVPAAPAEPEAKSEL